MARRLCFEERARIEVMNEAGFNATEIAVSLGRHPNTVQRELDGAAGAAATPAERRAWSSLTVGFTVERDTGASNGSLGGWSVTLPPRGVGRSIGGSLTGDDGTPRRSE